MLHVPPADYDPELLVNCREKVVRATPCNTHECDVDCQLSEWTEWPKGECSRSCGNGTQVERRYVVMGPKGNGKVCPPWHTMGVRVRTVSCNPFPCEPSCSQSELAEKYRALAEASPIQLPVQDDEGEAPNASSENQTGEAPNASSDNQTGDAPNASSNNQTAKEAPNTTGTPKQPQNSEEGAPAGAPNASAPASDEDGDEESKQSLLSLGTQRGSGNSGSEIVAYETPRLETGLVKSACDEPCGGGKRVVLIPSDKKVSFGEEDRSCSYTFKEDCNLFACTPLMLQPANAWQYPLVGQWFMVDVSFVIESCPSLSPSARLRISCWPQQEVTASASWWSTASRTWKAAPSILGRPATAQAQSWSSTSAIPWSRKIPSLGSGTGTTSGPGSSTRRTAVVA